MERQINNILLAKEVNADVSPQLSKLTEKHKKHKPLDKQKAATPVSHIHSLPFLPVHRAKNS
jgi:hypothetical protein